MKQDSGTGLQNPRKIYIEKNVGMEMINCWIE